MDNFKLTINDFEGPLDLLLHLVKESKMDIYDLQIEKITKQYIDFIESMKNLDIDIASEYLVMATSLVHIKSKMLVNIKDEEEEETQEEITTKEELERRLIEYEEYKRLSEDFKELESKRQEVFTKLPESLSEYREEIELNTDTTLDDLIKAFEDFLSRQKFTKPLDTKITTRELSISRRSKEIRNIIKYKKKVDFFELFEEITKPYIVVTFLSVLEMAKTGEINIKQDKNFDNIIIEAK